MSAVFSLGSTGSGRWFRTTGLSGGVRSHSAFRLMRWFYLKTVNCPLRLRSYIAVVMLNTVLFER